MKIMYLGLALLLLNISLVLFRNSIYFKRLLLTELAEYCRQHSILFAITAALFITLYQSSVKLVVP